MIGELLQKWWIKPVALVLLVLILCPPALAQEVSGADACAEGERDAEADVSKTVFFIVGCVGSVAGLLVAYIYQPSPPAAKLLGKSPEYVAMYTDCYKRKAKNIQIKTTLIGCGVSGLVCVAYYLFWVAAIFAAASED
ncbi:MAG: hypothetical protein ACE5K2_04635 [Candidatus Zixiibacteriota bacterium]